MKPGERMISINRVLINSKAAGMIWAIMIAGVKKVLEGRGDKETLLLLDELSLRIATECVKAEGKAPQEEIYAGLSVLLFGMVGAIAANIDPPDYFKALVDLKVADIEMLREDFKPSDELAKETTEYIAGQKKVIEAAINGGEQTPEDLLAQLFGT